MAAEDTIREKTLETQRDILDIEWMMFTAVHGGNGRVFSEADRRSFAIMRLSMFSTWEKFTFDSYLNDLRVAADSSRNLFVEKYYHMIEKTDPESYLKARAFLPILDPTSCELIEAIVKIYAEWEEEVTKDYPVIARVALPMDNLIEGEDTSYAHYLSCELRTYSKKTLTMLYSSLVAFPDRNRYYESLDNLMKAHGFASLAEAEEFFTQK